MKTQRLSAIVASEYHQSVLTEQRLSEVTVELKNTFHGTRVHVRVPAAHAENAWSYLQWMAIDGDDSAKRKVARISRELCPRSNCQCGTVRN